MNTILPVRQQMNDRLQIALPSEQKRRAFEVAAREGVSVGQLIRSALDRAINERSGIHVGEAR